MTKHLYPFLILIIGIQLFGCSKAPEMKILGAWMSEDGGRMEFFEDGTATVQRPKEAGLAGMPYSGTWTRLSDGRFKLSLSFMGMNTMNTFEAAFPDINTMEVTIEGETLVLKRQ